MFVIFCPVQRPLCCASIFEYNNNDNLNKSNDNNNNDSNDNNNDDDDNNSNTFIYKTYNILQWGPLINIKYA